MATKEKHLNETECLDKAAVTAILELPGRDEIDVATVGGPNVGKR